MTTQSLALARQDRPGFAIGAMLAAMGVFAVVDSAAKVLGEAGYPTAQLVFFRMLFGTLPAIVLLRAQGIGWDGLIGQLRTSRWPLHAARAGAGLCAIGFFFAALPHMPLADAVALSFTKVLFLTLLAGPLLGERVGRLRWGATVAGFVGALFIVAPSGAVGGALGPILTLLAAASMSLSMISIRLLSRTEGTPAIVLTYTVVALLASGLVLPFVWVTPSWSSLPLFLAMGLAGGVGQLLLTTAYRHAPASLLGPFNYSALLWATAIGWVVWGQVPGPHTLLGAALVVGAGLFLMLRDPKSAH